MTILSTIMKSFENVDYPIEMEPFEESNSKSLATGH